MQTFKLNTRVALLSTIVAVLAATITTGYCASLADKFIYIPRVNNPKEVQAWKRQTRGVVLHYKTSQGAQEAYLQGNLRNPQTLWLVCGGNASLAIEFAPWFHQVVDAKQGWLFFDYPGYGDCQGECSPTSIAESLRAAVAAGLKYYGWDAKKKASRLRFFGHSLGCAACMIAANECNIHKGVLVAPFTSIDDMVGAITVLPLQCFISHHYDNKKQMQILTKAPDARVIIVHGDKDEVVPYLMGKKLAAMCPAKITYVQVKNARHNDIFSTDANKIKAATQELIPR